MPARGYPLDIDAIILFELARGMGSGPELLRRTRVRMREKGYALNYGAWYPALRRLETKGFLVWGQGRPPFRRGHRIPKIYALTPKGQTEALRLSTVIRSLLLPPEASA